MFQLSALSVLYQLYPSLTFCLDQGLKKVYTLHSAEMPQVSFKLWIHFDLFFPLIIYLIKNLGSSPCRASLRPDFGYCTSVVTFNMFSCPLFPMIHLWNMLSSISKKSKMALSTSNKIELMFCFIIRISGASLSLAAWCFV